MKAILTKSLRTCKHGHEYYKSSDCPICPVCEATKKSTNGFLSKLSAPARRALQNANISTAQQLAKYSEKDFLQMHGIGKSSLPILKTALEKAGLAFRN